MVELGNIIDKFGVYIYKSPLIFFRVENLDSWKHREVVVKKDPIANAYICKLVEEIFTELPEFKPEFLKGETLKEWIREGWTDLLIAMMIAARTHRWCIVKLYDEEPYWRVFTYREVRKINYNKLGVPISAKVEWSETPPLSEEIINFKETVMFNKPVEGKSEFDGLFVSFGVKSGKDVGTCDLEAIWDLLAYTRYQLLDIVNNSAKTSGFWHIVYGSAIKSDHITELKNGFDYTGVGQAIGAKETIIKEINFHTPDHPEFTIEAMDESLKLIAGNTRLPTSFFVGQKDTGGVFQEGFSDEAKINKKKKYIFGQFKSYIIDLIRMRWGVELDDVLPYIEEDIQMDQKLEQNASSQFQNDAFGNKKEEVSKKIA